MMKNRTTSQHSFAIVPTVAKPRSVFSRDHSYKTCFDADYLVPFYWRNVLPGDTVKLRHSMLIRLLSPAIKPIMDNVHFDFFYFFVPYRLLWTNFKRFMGEQDEPDDTIDYNVPQCTAPNVASGGIQLGSLHDYFALPTGALSGGGGTTGVTFNNLYLRAYNKIWNDHFRDQNLQDSVVVDLGDGPDTYTDYVLLKRGKRHDYFTSALPWLQKAASSVELPLGDTAPVESDGSVLQFAPTGYPAEVRNINNVSGAKTIQASSNWVTNDISLVFADQGLQANLSEATAASINTLRQSIALQQFLENDARGGTRYVEIVKHRWGVTSPDMRQQRSELLSLGTSQLKISTVASTAAVSPAADGGNLGDLASFGTGANVGNGFTKSFTEHGCLIGLANVRADLNYCQGMDKDWSYRTRYDFYNPEFANLGEQPIYNREIYANVPDGTGASQKDGVFGYQERYAEERYSRNYITSYLRVGQVLTLDVWHLAEEFSSLPTLSSTFIQSSTPLDRCVQMPEYPHFMLDVAFDEKWARVMPMFSVPGLLKL